MDTTIAIPKPTILEPKIESIPRALRAYPSWVVWRLEKGKDKKWTKVPRKALSDRRASHSDLRTWCAYPDACEAYQGGGYDGLGFVFSTGDPFTGIDLDECRDPDSGDLSPLAQEVIAMLDGLAYVELSATGTGVHLIVRGRVRKPVKNDDAGVEIYSAHRFFTITGRKLHD
jgi:putative DNA primase/helicase